MQPGLSGSAAVDAVCHGKPIGEVDRPGTIRLVAVGSRRRHVVALSSSDPAQRPYVLTVARDEV